MAGEAAGLEIETDSAFQERLWTLQRVAWVLMALVVIAALIGLTGRGGSYAHATVEAEGDGVALDYPRIARWQAADQMVLRIPDPSGDRIDVTLSGKFAELFTVESVQPQPASSAAVADGHRLTFDLGSEAGPRSINFTLRALKPALPTGFEVAAGDGPPLRARTVVLP
jgi:hypothetical protein